MHFVVTGGAGFIGSHIVRELQRKFPKAKISVVDDFRSGNFKNLLGFKGDVFAIDVARENFSRLFTTPVDAIFHLASITDTTVLDQKKMLFDNVEGFRQVLDFSLSHKVSLVYASSAATYGKGKQSSITEDEAALPENIYAFSKAILDNLAKEAASAGKTKIVGLRYFNVYGPGESHKGKAASMIYQLFLQMREGKRPRIFIDGEQKRDFVYVEDVVCASIQALKAPQSNVYNVGSGVARSFNDVIVILNRVMGTDLQPEYFENPYPFYQDFTQADISKAKRGLGYVPSYSLEKGIAAYMEQSQSIS